MFRSQSSHALGAPRPGSDPDSIATEVRQALARATLRFRLIFIATWVVLIGGLLAALTAGGKFDGAFLESVAWYILGGVGLTILISVVSILFAIVFALLGALGRLSRSAPLYAIATLYVSLVRGTPLLVQIFFVYLALPQIIPEAAGIPLVALGMFSLAFNYGAYMTEIFRAGIQAVPRGQREAAEALGMPEGLVMRRIVLPQARRASSSRPSATSSSPCSRTRRWSPSSASRSCCGAHRPSEGEIPQPGDADARGGRLLGADDRLLAVPGQAGAPHGSGRSMTAAAVSSASAPLPDTALVRTTSLHKHFGDNHVLRGVDLAVQPHETVRGHRPLRQRQDHAAALPQLP